MDLPPSTSYSRTAYERYEETSSMDFPPSTSHAVPAYERSAEASLMDLPHAVSAYERSVGALSMDLLTNISSEEILHYPMGLLPSTSYARTAYERYTGTSSIDFMPSTSHAVPAYDRSGGASSMDLPPSTSYAVHAYERSAGASSMDLLTNISPAGTSHYPFSAWNRQVSGYEVISSPHSSSSSGESSPNYESKIVENELLIEKLREVLSIKILEENTEHSSESDTERDSQVLLSEVYVESPGLLGTKKCLEPSPEENNFFEFSKAILLGNESSFSLEDFSEIHPDITVIARVFLHFICVDNTRCTDPKLLMKFLTVIAAMFSNSKLVLNEMQICMIVKFLLHCLFVDINHMKHGEFRQIVAQMLTMFTNGSSIISKKLYSDIIEHFSNKIDYFPLDLYHWNAILLTVEFMGVSAIQSIIIPNFSDICKLLDKSLNSLESYNCRMIVSIFKQTAEGNVYTESQENEIKKFNCAMKTYLDAANVYALFLKLCAVLIEDVIKEDIRTKKRVIYIPKEIDDLLEREEILEPEPIKYKFDHEEHKSFFDNCFQYFGNALNAHILSVFIEYERSNYIKADFFKEKYKLYTIENRYLVFADSCEGKQKKSSRMRNKPQTVPKKFDYCQKTFVFMNPPNHRLGSILTTPGEGKVKKLSKVKVKGSSKKYEKNVLSKVEESKRYLTSLRNVPEPWLRVLRKRYESQHMVQPEHWKFTGNLETYI